MIHCREIIKKVLRHKTLSIIVVQDHPSGDTEPSDENYDVTKKNIVFRNKIKYEMNFFS
jgi:DNA repair protein RadC